MTDESYDALEMFFQEMERSAPSDLSDGEREWVETYLLRAFDRMQAAHYHIGEIDALEAEITGLASDSQAIWKQHCQPPTGANAVTSIALPSREIAYEIDAFLSAIRSTIDFVAMAMAKFIIGVGRVRSITTFRERAAKDPTFPFASLTLTWDKWIGQIKAYRDEFVHYRTLRGSSGFTVTRTAADTTVHRSPFSVPRSALDVDEPDTRARRMRRDVSGGVPKLDTMESADAFCRRHMNLCEQFFKDALSGMLATEFNRLKPAHGKSSKKTPL